VIVVDASLVVELLLKTPKLPAVASLVAGQDVLAAPVLLDYEVMSVLRRHALARDVSDAEAKIALADLARLRIDRYDIEPFVDRIWSLRQNLTVYDASYVALAEYLAVPLHTFDARLAASPGHRARIIAM
jgi:predicted nucleic acid-binding protein